MKQSCYDLHQQSFSATYLRALQMKTKGDDSFFYFF